MKRISSWILLIVEAVLFCTFVTMDIMNMNTENIVKFIAISLVGIFGLRAGKQKDNIVVTIALLFTMLADVFLILVGNFVAGVCVFICVQTCYTVRFSFMSGKPLVGELLKRLLPGLILGSLVTYFIGIDVGIVVAYACSFAVNFAHGFELHILKPSPRHLRFAIGLFLFACCDICVGIHNLSPIKIMGLRVVAALTMVGAALGKYGKSEAGAVGDGLTYHSCYSQLRHCALLCPFLLRAWRCSTCSVCRPDSR